MSRCAFFMSAPTLRFLRVLDRLRVLPLGQQRKIAASVYTQIKPLVRSADLDELSGATQIAQDERWRLVSAGTCDMTDARLAGVVLTEQWLRARAELIRGVAPVAEVLAEKRREAIEAFICDNLSFKGGEIVELHPPLQRIDRAHARSAA